MNNSDCELSGIEVVFWHDICRDSTSWNNQQVLPKLKICYPGAGSDRLNRY